jgi:Ribbon-helix-helix protein, copG family
MGAPERREHRVVVKMTDSDKQILSTVCEQTGRDQSEAIREAVRQAHRELTRGNHRP